MKKAVATVLIPLLLSGCAHQRKTIGDESRYSTVETEIGEAIHKQILQSMPVCHDEKLNDYVRSIGQKIAQKADRQDLSYRFVILEDERIYATHAPGGYVYVTTGFFKFLQSEIELAGILAHEIALLQYKDPRLSRLKKTLDFLVLTGSYVGPAFGSIGALSVLGLVLIANVTGSEKSLGRRIREGDKLALQYMVESGYDPQGLIDSLRRMIAPQSPYRPYLFDYLQSHPVTPERLRKLDEIFQKLPLANKHFEARRSEFLTATEPVRNSFARK